MNKTYFYMGDIGGAKALIAKTETVIAIGDLQKLIDKIKELEKNEKEHKATIDYIYKTLGAYDEDFYLRERNLQRDARDYCADLRKKEAVEQAGKVTFKKDK